MTGSIRVAPGGADGDDLRSVLRHNVRLGHVEYLPIDTLRSYGRKLRARSKEAGQALCNSISHFGIVAPILIDATSMIISGEGIVEAARSAGYTEVPTLRIEHLSDAEVRVLRLALNKLAEHSEWSTIDLAAEIVELSTMQLDFSLDLSGFSSLEIDAISFPSTAEAQADEPVEVGEPGSAVSRLGDVWGLGAHEVLCGSSLEEANVAKLMGRDQAAMVLTDHPFNLKISGLVRTSHREFAEASGEMSEAQFIAFLTQSMKVLAAHCADGALLYMYMDWRHQWEMLSAIRANALTLINMAVWVKAAPAMGSFYRSQHELCFIAKKGSASYRNNIQLGANGRNRSNVWNYAGMNTFSPERAELLATHPTCKNTQMLADAICDTTIRGDVVLEGFLGSGSTLIAAERTGRVCRGVEIDPLYVDATIRRWEKTTGRQVLLLETGETFEEVAARRVAEVARPDVVARPRVRRAA